MGSIPIPIPDIPKDLPNDQSEFLGAVKDLLENINGLRNPDYAALLGTASVSATAIRTAIEFPQFETGSIRPPTNFVITVREWSHLLEWVNTADDHLDGVEVWCHTEDSVTEATRIAVCGRRTNAYERFGFDPTVDWYYWIRSLSYTGKYSTWVPTTLMGGVLVPRRESLRERIEGIMNALKGDDPDPYSAAVAYEIDDPVSYIGDDGNKRRYRRRNYDIGASDKDPTLTLYWERTGILMEGEIDGVNTVGIDGQLVVDGSILARSIQTDTLTVGDGSNGTIKIEDGAITVVALSEELADDVLNTNVVWQNIGGDGKPEDNSTSNMVYVQSTAPSNPLSGALWIDTSKKPYRHKIFYNGLWRTAATDNTDWEHPSNVTRIDGGNIYTGTIVANAIAANAIVANHIGANTIITQAANIANAVITTAKIQNAAITNAKIANAAITNAKIANAAITYAKIGVGEVDTLSIKGQAVTLPINAYTAGVYTLSTSYETVQSLSVNSGGSFMQLPFSVRVATNAPSFIVGNTIAVRVLQDSAATVLWENEYDFKSGIAWKRVVSDILLLTPTLGTHTYYLQVKKLTGYTSEADLRALTAIVFKR